MATQTIKCESGQQADSYLRAPDCVPRKRWLAEPVPGIGLGVQREDTVREQAGQSPPSL